MIYFIRRPDDGAIKIGYTDQPSTRMPALRREVDGMELLAVMDGGFPEEQGLHVRFDHLCLGNAANHEWFRAAPELLAFIEAEGRPMVDTDRSFSVRLDLTPEQRDRLRVVAAEAGLSMAAFARTALLEAVEVAEKRRRPR